MSELNISDYNPEMDTIEIEGTRYSGALFRELGCSFPTLVGQTIKIIRKENGLVTIERMRDDPT